MELTLYILAKPIYTFLWNEKKNTLKNTWIKSEFFTSGPMTAKVTESKFMASYLRQCLIGWLGPVKWPANFHIAPGGAALVPFDPWCQKETIHVGFFHRKPVYQEYWHTLFNFHMFGPCENNNWYITNQGLGHNCPCLSPNFLFLWNHKPWQSLEKVLWLRKQQQ